jgi:hypothetical protein
VPTEHLKERRGIRILHLLVLCLSRLCRPCILLPSDLFSGRSYLCPGTPHFLEVLFHLPVRCSGIFLNLCRFNLHNRCRGILNGLCEPNLCLRIFLGSPSLEFPKQGLVLTIFIFNLTLMGGFKRSSNLIAGRRVL